MSELVTNLQKRILLYLFQFRFITTNQFQKLLLQKDITYTQVLLKNLAEQGYAVSMYLRKKRSENTKPSIYHLGTRARRILKDEGCDPAALNFIYKERGRTRKFIDHFLTLTDIYLFLLSQKGKNEELKFFTKTMLAGYDYFPQPLPDGYIDVKEKNITRRYFLDLFDEYTPPFVYRKRLKQYLTYSANGDWKANTNTPFPILLFVCPNETAKKHVYWYGKNVITKSFEQISLFVTTTDTIQFGAGKMDVWQKVI
jgi:hypothetical protein